VVGGGTGTRRRGALTVRPLLRWALAATLVASAAAVWWPTDVPRVVAAAQRPASADDAVPLQAGGTPLPQALPAWDLGPARRDPFVPVSAPPPAEPPPVPMPVAVDAVEAQAPPSAPPPLTMRYLGTMVTPNGETLVMLARDDMAIPVQAGTQLHDGYVVRALTADAVRLAHPATGAVVELALPANDVR
jgi:hypothetical protein